MYKILIVDDQPEVRNLLELSLDAFNYEVHHAIDWITALAMARAVKPDLVLLDILMPGEHDGLEVCKRIKNDAALSETAIIIITARIRPGDRQLSIDAGADEFISKPFSPMYLVERVAEILARKNIAQYPDQQLH